MAGIENQQLGHAAGDLCRVVRDEDHAGVQGEGGGLDRGKQTLAAGLVQTEAGLVENQERGTMHGGPGQQGQAAVASGQTGERLISDTCQAQTI